MGKIARILTGITAIVTLLVPLTASTPPAHADTSDFSYDSWHVHYQLGIDDEGRAITEVTETLTARFPDFDQNRGIVRGIPLEYQKANTNPRNFSVTDLSRSPIPFEIEEDNNFVAVLTGDDNFVRGLQSYVISYTLSDTVLSRDDGTADEFYWDLVDFEHLQRIDKFTANIALSPELASQLNGNTQCYVGVANSTSNCEVTRNESGTEFTVPAIPLAAQEGVSIAIGLNPGSVVQPAVRLPDFTLDTLPLFISGAALAAGIASGAVIFVLRRKRRVGRGVVVAQYDVPTHLPPLLAAPIVGASASPVPAEFVHLAVSGVTRLEETTDTKKPRPAIRLLDPTRLGDELDTAMVQDLFPDATPGTVTQIPKKSEKFAKRMEALQASGSSQALSRGYFEKVASPTARWLGIIALGIAAALLVFVVLGFASRNSATPLIGLFAAILAIVLGIVGVSKQRVYTPAGAETREYLEGVREFIRVAEAERLRMLQSYEGAERLQDGSVNVVHLYEKLLPYAMLFGLEKQWGKTLETQYQAHPGYVPYWYPGIGVHGLSSFNSTLSQFTSSLSSSVSYSSSSSGGSTGGGFAGGGGGGGFSGGR